MESVRKLRRDFERVVTGYVTTFSKLFELNQKDCWWVGDRIGLDLFCFGDMYYVTLDEMIYIVENGVTFDEYLAYIDYNEKCAEFKLNGLNLKSWHTGAPRVQEFTFARLSSLKKQIDDLCDEARKTTDIKP